MTAKTSEEKTTDTGRAMKRITEIRARMGSLGPILLGTLTPRTRKYTLKDGTVMKTKDQSLFKYAKTGNRKCKRIPEEAEQEVSKMIAKGREYRKLRDEYEKLITELSLENALKKTTVHAAPRDGVPVRGDKRSARGV